MSSRPALHAYSATMAVRRRSAAERRVLMLMRGDADEPAPNTVGPENKASRDPPSRELYFAELRRAATPMGLAVQPPDAPFVNEDELLLLGWIAQAQRIMNYTVAMPDDPVLVAAIARCAGMLDAMGVRLSPLTIYAANRKGGRDET